MELISYISDRLRNKTCENVWVFTRNAHLGRLLISDRLNKMLDEYLFVIQKRCGDKYETRLANGVETKRGMMLCIVDHLTSFQNVAFENLCREDNKTIDEICEMTFFYDDLLDIVDGAIEEQYVYGKKFNKNEKQAIYDIGGKMLFDICPIKKIHISVPYSFEYEDYEHIMTYDEDFTYEIDDDGQRINLIFENYKKSFDASYLFIIKKFIPYPTDYYIEWHTIRPNYLHIAFYPTPGFDKN